MALIETPTEAEAAKTKTINTIRDAVYTCSKACDTVREVAAERGGVAAFASELGADAAAVQAAYTLMKDFVDTASDLSTAAL